MSGLTSELVDSDLYGASDETNLSLTADGLSITIRSLAVPLQRRAWFCKLDGVEQYPKYQLDAMSKLVWGDGTLWVELQWQDEAGSDLTPTTISNAKPPATWTPGLSTGIAHPVDAAYVFIRYTWTGVAGGGGVFLRNPTIIAQSQYSLP